MHGVNADDIDVLDEAAAEAYGQEVEEKSFKMIGEVLQQLAPARLGSPPTRTRSLPTFPVVVC